MHSGKGGGDTMGGGSNTEDGMAVRHREGHSEGEGPSPSALCKLSQRGAGGARTRPHRKLSTREAVQTQRQRGTEGTGEGRCAPSRGHSI